MSETPDLPKTNLGPGIRFPRTRAEAEIVTEQVRIQARKMGCRCESLKVQFVEPNSVREKPFVHVEHERLCLLGYGGGMAN